MTESTIKLAQALRISSIKMVNNAIIDDIAKIPESFINNQLSILSNNFSYSTWGLISIIFSFSFLLIFVLYFFSKEPIVKRTSFVVDSAIVCLNNIYRRFYLLL